MSRRCFLFVHGWSFDATIWDAVRGHLPDADTAVVEHGYLDGVPRWPDVPAGAVAVGHSAGLLDLLADPPPGCVGLVAINGFTRFAAGPDFPHGVPDRLLQRMLGRLAIDPAATVSEFRSRCGGGLDPAATLRSDRLRRGLLSLCERDARRRLSASGLRVLALAGRLDPIVPPAMTSDCFEPAATGWHDEGGHLLPLTDPVWCAARLRAFAG